MTKKRYCDFCNDIIANGETYIKLTQIEHKTEERKSNFDPNKTFTYQTYPQKVIGEMCIKCKDKLKEK